MGEPYCFWKQLAQRTTDIGENVSLKPVFLLSFSRYGVYSIFFHINRSSRWNKLIFAVNVWKRYKGVHRYTYKWTKWQTNLRIIFFNYFILPPPPKHLGNIGEFSNYLQTSLPTFQYPDFLQSFQSFQTCRHHVLSHFS